MVLCRRLQRAGLHFLAVASAHSIYSAKSVGCCSVSGVPRLFPWLPPLIVCALHCSRALLCLRCFARSVGAADW